MISSNTNGIIKQKLVNSEFMIEEGVLKCEICGKKFSHFSRLNAHKQFHTGKEKPKCNVCEQDFSDPADHEICLNQLKLAMYKQWSKCHLCGKGLSDFSGNVHTNIYAYTFQKKQINVCDTCKTETGRKGNIYESFSKKGILEQDMRHRSLFANQGSTKYEMTIDDNFMVMLDEDIEVSTEEIVIDNDKAKEANKEENAIDHKLQLPSNTVKDLLQIATEELKNVKKEFGVLETTQVPLFANSTDSFTLGENDSGIDPGTYIFCKFCQAYVVQDFFIKHQMDEHPPQHKMDEHHPQKMQEYSNQQDPDQLHCEECGKLFTSYRAMKGHKKEQHSGIMEKYKCLICGKEFSRNSNLKAHKDSAHFGKTFSCSICKQKFTDSSSMRNHKEKSP